MSDNTDGLGLELDELRARMDVVEQTSPPAPAPAPAPAPPPVGGTLPDFSQPVSDYLAAFATYGDIRWVADEKVYISKRGYYDRVYFWYALRKPTRGDIDAAAQVVAFDLYKYAPRYWNPDGVVELYGRTGDPKLIATLEKYGNYTNYYPNYIKETGVNWEGRIQERALLQVMACDAVGGADKDWTAQAVLYKDAILASQNADGSWTPPGSAYTAKDGSGQVSTNFMSAAAMSAAIRYAEYYGDDVANIQATVEAGAEWLWQTQWRPADASFNYWSALANGGYDKSAPALNMLFVDVFGWLYFKTGDTKWITRGDLIFNGAIASQSYRDGHKQFNQFFRNSWRYLYYRDGFDISHLTNPIEVHL